MNCSFVNRKIQRFPCLLFLSLLLVSCTASPALTPTTVLPPVAAPDSANLIIDPAEQTIPAGASASFLVSIPNQIPASDANVRWSIIDAPAQTTIEFFSSAVPITTTLVVHTACALPQGRLKIQVQATVGDKTQTGVARLNITGKLIDSVAGKFSGSFTDNPIWIRRGGPSTLQSGPFTPLQFCESAAPRTLKVVVESATSDAGKPLTEPPRFSLFKSFVYPAPNFIQTASGGYRANASEVAQGKNGELEWSIAPGIYVVVFQKSPVEEARPPEQRPASVNWRIDFSR